MCLCDFRSVAFWNMFALCVVLMVFVLMRDAFLEFMVVVFVSDFFSEAELATRFLGSCGEGDHLEVDVPGAISKAFGPRGILEDFVSNYCWGLGLASYPSSYKRNYRYLGVLVDVI